MMRYKPMLAQNVGDYSRIKDDDWPLYVQPKLDGVRCLIQTEYDPVYKAVPEEDLLVGELAKLMTLMNMYQEREEYEKCATIKKEIDKINKQ